LNFAFSCKAPPVLVIAMNKTCVIALTKPCQLPMTKTLL
jgi:hypothetical protein